MSLKFHHNEFFKCTIIRAQTSMMKTIQTSPSFSVNRLVLLPRVCRAWNRPVRTGGVGLVLGEVRDGRNWLHGVQGRNSPCL